MKPFRPAEDMRDWLLDEQAIVKAAQGTGITPEDLRASVVAYYDAAFGRAHRIDLRIGDKELRLVCTCGWSKKASEDKLQDVMNRHFRGAR